MLPEVEIKTSKGNIRLELFEDDAPNTVANFISLIENDFYSGIIFHRVIPNFMIQAGCPDGRGSGGPGYRIYDEINQHKHERGVISMANAGPNTNGSQFFITYVPCDWLDGKHTVFGRVIDGMWVVDKIKENDKIEEIVVLKKRDHVYEPKKM